MKSGVVGIVVVGLQASCAMGPVHVEEDFGQSVRQMVEGQIDDPEAAANPSPIAPDLLDGVSAEHAVTEYRRGARRDEGARPTISLSVD